jgi:hypothetical protein
MDFEQYFENVYFQFYNKIDEVDCFLKLSIDNHTQYSNSKIPRDFSHFNTAQFYFSAFINSLISTWEIAKLTISIENTVDKLDSQNNIIKEKLLSNKDDFLKYFDGANNEDFELFNFLKVARNACSHDGTISLNGARDDKFNFIGDFERYDFNNSDKKFTYTCFEPPQHDAIKTMLLMATRLLPLFETKLKKPKRPYLFEELHPNAMDKSQNIPTFIDKYSSYL